MTDRAFQSYKLGKYNTSVFWELTSDGFMSRTGGESDNDFHPLNITETCNRAGSMGHLVSKGFSLAPQYSFSQQRPFVIYIQIFYESVLVSSVEKNSKEEI